jgi:chromate transporter
MTHSTAAAEAREAPSARAPGLAALFFSFLRLGLTCFGGPAMVAYIKEMVVARKRWLDEETMNDGIVLSQSLPGVIAMDTAAYVGLRLRGIRGAFATYIGFTLPAFLLMLGLTALYVAARTVPRVVSLMTGLQVLVVAIVANATYSFGKSVTRDWRSLALAAVCGALLVAGANPFLVIVGAGFIGVLLFPKVQPVNQRTVNAGSGRSMLKKVALLALIPLAGLAALFFLDRKLFGLALLMMKINVFSFGGGYTALPLMLHEVVSVHGWMTESTLMDGIALGQVTPGPISITATFIGYVLFGLAGAVVATLAIYTPCFLLLLAVVPYFDRLKSSAPFARATKGIAASFVGLLVFATVKFGSAVHWDAVKIAVALAALLALLRKVDILWVVLAGAIVSVLLF